MSRRLSNGANDSPYHIQLKQRMSSTPARNSENGDRNKPIFCIENSPSMTDIRLSRDLDGNSHFQQSSRLYKIIVIGEVSTGKSALIKRYVHNFFADDYRCTIGVDFQLKMLKFNDELEIRLQLWDIGGQERFSSMTRAYYKGAVGAAIVFDQTNARTFYAAIERWKADVDEKVKLPGYKNKNIPVLLMCNKSDRPKDPNLPSDLEISEIVQNHNFIPKWIKTSAKTGAGVREAFNIIVRYTQCGPVYQSITEILMH